MPIVAMAEPAQNAPAGTSKGFVANIEKLTEDNDDFRRVLYTSKELQLVVMSVAPGQHVGLEKHDVDQFFRIEDGTGEVVVEGRRTPVGPGSAIVIPANTRHDIINTGKDGLKIYTIYAPPKHRQGVVQHTKAEADREPER
jgi:mannose-6-phosphate isomerase-like protein (cupin superfamily)